MVKFCSINRLFTLEVEERESLPQTIKFNSSFFFILAMFFEIKQLLSAMKKFFFMRMVKSSCSYTFVIQDDQ